MTDRKRHGLILLLVIGLIAASVAVILSKPTKLGLDLKGGVELVFEAQPTAQSKVDNDSIARAIQVMRNRIDQLGVSEPQIQQEGPNLIDVQLPNVHNVSEAEAQVGKTARLAFYDWEANLIMPGTVGQTVASQLLLKSDTAIALSQGSSATGPGSNSSTVGAMNLYDAVELAAKQPYSASSANANNETMYYLFGAPGSSACAAYAKAAGTAVNLNAHCLIASIGVKASTSNAQATAALKAGLSSAETTATQVLVVQRGTIVLQAAPSSFSHWPTFGTPTAGYYVLKDRAALFGNKVSNPQESTDSSGSPDVSFSFNSNGAQLFQQVTGEIAQRGEQLKLIGLNDANQHFAAALDNQILSVAQINFSEYPDGIDAASGGAEITGGFTIDSAKQLATELRLGALPVRLVRISESQVSATLGSQALHKGLVAGVIGLAVVMLFLIFYYRLLGVIAVGGLITYGVYFYALIKLIPITLTLAGIAGLILTIGVAADANVVIFERVKEEIRAGRSVRQGIVTGYRKGLTAIVDGNVVTIMTAFILFVLASADVKGFAFTLGVGTAVSLFTAVLATQAILLTLSDTRAIAGPSALGAGGRKHAWRYDFMGAGRYFFTMSGVILLVGSIAIGAKGLNLGIDFTSGTQISAGLSSPANVGQIHTLVSNLNQPRVSGDVTVQAIDGGELGKYGVQISMKYLSQADTTQLRSELQDRYGAHQFNTEVIGPTFGNAVAHSAVVALIVSLLLISVYITLRFDRKYAVPVLIALMHDLLITAGVYALTGKVVSTDTVAALLTILGYSMYDTIIVFDRVRENVPRMPRAAFSQIVNRSMSEVLTRSLVTTSCTLLPIIALLIFGGSSLKDFAFALLIGVASGAYSSIFIASPVLTHWKEREPTYRARRARITGEFGLVPAYADGGDVEPIARREARQSLIAPAQGSVSNEEFAQMERELGLGDAKPAGRGGRGGRGDRGGRGKGGAATAVDPAAETGASAGGGVSRPGSGGKTPLPTRSQRGSAPPADAQQSVPDAERAAQQHEGPSEPNVGAEGARPPVQRAPDIAENDGVVERKPGTGGPQRPPRNRKHGRRR